MQDKELDAFVAQHVFGQSVTWLRQPGGKREPWMANTLVYGDAPTVGPGRPWMRRVNDDDMEVWIDPNTALLVPRYSTDIAAAWEVVEAMRGHGFYSQHTDLTLDSGVEWWSWHFVDHRSVSAASIGATADTAPRAICLAALKALGVEVPS